MSKPPGRMSGAEFVTLRGACGLTQAEAAELVGMSRRSVEQWEDGSRVINQAAGDALKNLDDLIRDRTTLILQPLAQVKQRTRDRVNLIRYRTAQAYAIGEPRHVKAGLPLPAYHAMLWRVTDGLARLRVRYVVRWSDVVADVGAAGDMMTREAD